jgi:hypothetical protein
LFSILLMSIGQVVLPLERLYSKLACGVELPKITGIG